MRILIVHQNFPGQFRHIAPWLAENGHEVVCMGDASNLRHRPKSSNTYNLVSYQTQAPKNVQSHYYLRSLETAVRRGQSVARACITLKNKGFTPDLIIGHPAWGEMLFLRDVFPLAKIIAYFEYFYRAEGADVGFDPEFPSSIDARLALRIRNSPQLNALSECDAGISPTSWQLSTYPAHEQARIRIIHEGIDPYLLKPDPTATVSLGSGLVFSQRDQVVTFVSRNLEPYRGFHTFMRALPELQRRLPRAHFVLVGGDGVSYGRQPKPPYTNYREQLMAEVGSHLDLNRVHFTGRLPYGTYIQLLQVSRLHIYLTYPFVLSWSILEAMACGAPVLGSDTGPVRELITDGMNGSLFNFFDRKELVERAVDMVNRDTSEIRTAARSKLVQEYSTRDNSFPEYESLIDAVFDS